jgi:AcrR family transcriptional regulator
MARARQAAAAATVAPAAPVAAAQADGRKRLGRPPRIDRDTIARAVIEIGFDDVTMKRAAEHVGVSVPGLYHYVRGRDDLIRLAADYAIAAVTMPSYEGQAWDEWLREWGRYVLTSMASRPELLEHFLTGGLDDQRMVDTIDAALEPLVALGFTPQLAFEAYNAVTGMALGAAVQQIRERSANEAGRPFTALVRSVTAAGEAEQYAAMRALTTRRLPSSSDTFERRLDIVIDGLRGRLDDRLRSQLDDEPR